MTANMKYCFDDEDAEAVAENMGDIQVRRLPVVDRDKRLVGIISLGDIACTRKSPSSAAHALSGISEHGGRTRTGSEASRVTALSVTPAVAGSAAEHGSEMPRPDDPPGAAQLPRWRSPGR